jgi:micrococcal nuclease
LKPRVHLCAAITGHVLFCLVGALAGEGIAHAQPCPGLIAGPTHSITRVIDGETVALDDGSELRLIGALAPRAIDVGAEPGRWPIEVAAREELRALVLGKSVKLSFGGDRHDRYGRLLGHAVLVGDEERWVQWHLLEQGLARAYAQAGNRICSDELLTAERVAREWRRGLWADAAYRIRAAEKARELLAFVGTFQLVEGKIVRAASVRGTTYLNFAGRRRRAFSVSLARNEQYLLGPGIHDPSMLEGKLVRVRGWLERRRGPAIDLSAAGQIEVLEPGDGAQPPQVQSESSATSDRR